MIEAADIEQIRSIVYERADKTEAQIELLKDELVSDIKELSRKIDSLAKDHTALSERVIRLETCALITEDSRKEQGRRLGDVEQILAVIKGSQTGSEKEKANAKDWTRWAIPLVISIVMALFTVLHNLLR